MVWIFVPFHLNRALATHLAFSSFVCYVIWGQCSKITTEERFFLHNFMLSSGVPNDRYNKMRLHIKTKTEIKLYLCGPELAGFC